jgi:hypothetical protein
MEPITKTSHQQTRTTTKKRPTSKKLSNTRSFTLHYETMNVNHGIHHQKRITTKKKTIAKKLYYAATTRFSVQQQTTSPIDFCTITTLPPDSDEVNKPWTSTMGTHQQKRATTKHVPPPKRSITKTELPLK